MMRTWWTGPFGSTGWALVLLLSGCNGSTSGGEDGGDDACLDGCDSDTDDGTDDDGTDDGTNDEAPFCGNNTIDPGETCDPPSACPSDCDDSDPCTIDQMTGSASTCDVACTRAAIESCTGGDGCCPADCTLTVDADCPFYVDATGGNDDNDGLTPETAWQTAARASAEPLGPGDRLAFKRGEVWHETFHVDWSGSPEAPIVITSYGDGTEPPFFVPTQAVISWDTEANRVFSASLATEPRQVLVDGERLRFAHYPDDGYLYVDQYESEKTSFLDNDLTQSAEDVIGSTVLLRGNRWQLYTAVVSDFSGQTVILVDDPDDPYDPFRGLTSIQRNVGYVLTGKLWMLDAPGEWFYDTAAQKLYVRLADDGDPASHRIEISPAVHGIEAAEGTNIILDGLGVRHAGLNGIELQGPDGVHVRNCRVETSGLVGIRVYQPPAAAVVELDHNTIRTSNFAGIDVVADIEERQNVVVRGNRVEDTALDFPVESSSSYGWGYGVGLYLSGGGALAEDNEVYSSGYSCSILNGADHQMLHNHVERCCLIFDDGGGIYMTGTGLGYGHVVRGNTVVDSLGNAEGTPSFFTDQTTAAQGIYPDDGSHDIIIEDNTIVNADFGIQLHATQNDIVRGNTVFASRRAGVFSSADNLDNVIEENIFFSAEGAPAVYESYGSGQTVGYASYNSNLYWHQEGLRPLVRQITTAGTTSVDEYSLEEWRAETGFDADSTDLAAFYQVFPRFGRPTGASNLITNGAFDADVNGWRGWSSPSGLVSLAWASECGLSGGCLSAACAGASGGAYVGSNTFTVVKGQGYLLRFSVRADVRASLDGIIMKNSPDWNSLGVDRRITMVSARNDYVWPFIATTPDAATSETGFFYIGNSADFAFFLDDVDLREADVIQNDPADDAEIFINPTGTERTVDLGPAAHCDLDDVEVAGTITIPPFGSSVLLSCMCNNDGVCNNHETAASCSGDCP